MTAFLDSDLSLPTKDANTSNEVQGDTGPQIQLDIYDATFEGFQPRSVVVSTSSPPIAELIKVGLQASDPSSPSKKRNHCRSKGTYDMAQTSLHDEIR